LLVTANAPPPAAINTALMNNMRRRPAVSAITEKMTVSAADPASVTVNTAPICQGARPRPSRYTPRMTLRYP